MGLKPLKVGISYNITTKNYPLRKLTKALKLRSHSVYPFRSADLATSIQNTVNISAGDLDLTSLDLVFLRTLAPGTCDQITYRISTFDFLEKLGPVVINSTYPFRQTKDKFSALLTLHRAGIRIPKTFVSEPFKPAVEFSEGFKEVVIKPLIGSQGFGVIKTDSVDLAFTTLKHLSRLGQISYVQEYLPHEKYDQRVFVLGGEVLAAMARYSKEWKSNIAQGAKPRKIQPSPEAREMAIRSTLALGLDYSGVDIVEGTSGPYVIEVNAAPSWEGLQSVVDVDIAQEIVDYAIDKVKK